MSNIHKIAYHQGKRDELPNQKLAVWLAKDENTEGIKEIASYLNDKNKSIQSDCIKVLYEIGYISPKLISDYAHKFLALLDSKNNRMVWGAMIAIATIAKEVPEKLFPSIDKIHDLIETGSVITNDWGVKTLINLAGSDKKYYQKLSKNLLKLQSECRKKDFAKRAEDMWETIEPKDINKFVRILENRKPELSASAQKRLDKVIKKLS